MSLAAFSFPGNAYFVPKTQDIKSRSNRNRQVTAEILVEAKLVIKHLRDGDWILNSNLQGWMLARAEYSLSQKMISILMNAERRLPRQLRAIVRKGSLVPQNDGLPGIGESQTWRWQEVQVKK